LIKGFSSSHNVQIDSGSHSTPSSAKVKNSFTAWCLGPRTILQTFLTSKKSWKNLTFLCTVAYSL